MEENDSIHGESENVLDANLASTHSENNDTNGSVEQPPEASDASLDEGNVTEINEELIINKTEEHISINNESREENCAHKEQSLNISTKRSHTVLIPDGFIEKKDLTYNIRPAGLSSERCTRDFSALKNRKFYSPIAHMDETKYATEYSDSFGSENRHNIKRNHNLLVNGQKSPNTSNFMEAIYRDNCKMRNENRMKNQTHSYIFDDVPKVKRNRIMYQRMDSIDTTSTYADATASMLSIRTCSDSCQPTDTTDSIQTRLDSQDSLHEFTHSFQNEDAHFYHLDTARDHSSINGDSSRLMADLAYKNVELLTKSGSPVHIERDVNMNLSGLKKETTERDLERLARLCDIHVVSTNLDINIITHCCTGTGKIIIRRPEKDALARLVSLLNKRGFRVKM
ncbi:conserved hypothetical protein [Theileria equi strain WA]|uniref:Uncharacterized protein n=1 Tax=Theileria equi strain WA TaxID=1537102 RepID=L1LA48_THEEQ|nr:conserved hypothetical protein [Theileria equi strain WA]EKX72043.1 conserved hypothetical protein [Theileria equi strain WA]|eukprot:XP_004831495.1 conserved hypothetical protein [Theileria equi strain WA]